ncbi:biotin--[acetyl-CoA-carboxylase] ligase [Massilia norwichensis]|uniref:biotin--[biotin carboxyl-carrier protein] ligase n=1 Tax=Massilia norwichensis TaxID=1442366 RepID=A0ABT2ACS2_9BURK|nr:biotin--[acetyl-CoA-carboxylase] ligase [Massilia norwichensis]MCS0591910.1 biotin--[acetyl-CoA-carboxylase] ligase [Massilia norwichensis]
MNAQQIMALSRAGVAVEVVPETGSTNVDLLARAFTLQGPVLLVAEHQTAGRGRAGRSWLSSPDHSLTFSLAWKFGGGLQSLTGLPLAIGTALAETLGRLGQPVQLKWPNDVLKDGDKLAGILVETASAADGGVWAVIGIGLNLAMPDELEAQIGRSVAAVPWLARMERDTLLAAILDGLAEALRLFDQAGFGAFSARWNLLHGWQGQLVVILDRGEVLHEGLAAGVDDAGRLLLDTENGRIAIVAGDVSLRIKT